ncbi:MAG: PDZ domain-containing protein, partial [Phycisphaerales bacterium]|nr:PDZ domain-containing protein [Phycisphaerales bacterium]
GLAIPIEMIESVVDQLIEHREVSRGYVGVRLRDVDDRYDPDRELRARKTGFTGNGVEVVYVEPDSPADDAGLQRNDVITHVRGTAVGSLEQLRSMISSSMPGDRLAITIWRSGDDGPRAIDITLGRLDTIKLLAPPLRELLDAFGFRTLTTATPELAAARGVPYRRGVVIETIAPGSALQRAGVKPGAVLTRVHDRNVGTVDEFYARLMRVEYVVRRGVLLTVVNPGETDPIEVPLR